MDSKQNMTDTEAKLRNTLNFEFEALSQNLSILNLLNFSFATIVFFSLLYFIKRLIVKTETFVESLRNNISGWNFKGLVVLESKTIFQIIYALNFILKYLLYLGSFYFYITYVFGIFPATKGIADWLLKYLINITLFIFKTTLGFIPNLLTISVIIVFTLFLMRVAKLFVRALFLEKIIFPGFKKEWIVPTYDIAKFFIIVFAVIMVFPYLPGSNSPAFKGVSVFLGLLLTLGSSSAISNMIAGVVMIYMSPFKVGDYIKVADITGHIVEMELLVTRIKTIKNELVTIANSNILSKDIVNYSASNSANDKLMIYFPVGIGYDVSREKVEELLLLASANIEKVLKDPKSFVNILSFEQSFIQYELNCFIEDASIIPKIKSDLHKSILDRFNAEGIAILSPEFITVTRG